jgi:elongation factor Ts
MAISAAQVKELREKTGAPIMDCKRALGDADGDIATATRLLRERGIEVARKREGKAATEGTIATYVHHDSSIGTIVEVNCETDFVGKSDDLRQFAQDLAMHVAAAQPDYVSSEDVPGDALDRERDILREQARKEGKPDHIAEKMVEGRLRKFYQETCLLDQPFFRDEKGKSTVQDMLNELSAKVQEKIVVRRFNRYAVGQESEGE